MVTPSNELCAGCKVAGDCFIDNNTDKCPCITCLIKSICLELCEDAMKLHWALEVRPGRGWRRAGTT